MSPGVVPQATLIARYAAAADLARDGLHLHRLAAAGRASSTKGGPGNTPVIHKAQELTKRSPVSAIKEALRQAIQEEMGPKHIRALKGLLKVVKRGGTMGIVCFLMDCDTYTDAMGCIIKPAADCFVPWRPPVCEM